MSLRDHLAELRNRLLWSLLAVVIGIVVGYIFYDPLLTGLEKPYCDLPDVVRARALANTGCHLYFTHPLDGFSARLNIAMVSGLIISSPVWLYQLWAFVAPGLRKGERRWGVAFVAASIVLFAAGATFAFLVLHPALDFLLSASGPSVTSLLGVQEYLGFLGTLLLIFGASFEFPLLLVLLNVAGILTFVRMRSFWRATVMGVFVFAAVATPTQDPFSMLALAVPMCALYGVALSLAWLHDRGVAKRRAADPIASLDPDEATPRTSLDV
ncbi:MAG: sec-independent protein translocase protein TatC [Frankiaceae bacterium]|nr:sec-independent protein translocase protein TatC [Frankiaceae bacterium]MDQ1714086.1 sec-independent protein translocase protein TatC [Frankiaceae bacterium]